MIAINDDVKYLYNYKYGMFGKWNMKNLVADIFLPLEVLRMERWWRIQRTKWLWSGQFTQNALFLRTCQTICINCYLFEFLNMHIIFATNYSGKNIFSELNFKRKFQGFMVLDVIHNMGFYRLNVYII